jgi:hypothetical protein
MAGSLAERVSAIQEAIAGDVADNGFSILRQISQVGTLQPALGRDLLIRLMERREQLGKLNVIVDDLAVQYGLFPYVQAPGDQTEAGLIAYEMHAANPLGKEGFVFHALQAEIFRRLSGGENVILSAPTSFGKSVIIDALVASAKWKNIVLIVPTIALIDEIRRRLTRFSPTYKIVTHNAQEPAERNVFVLTQERFLEMETERLEIDMFIIDEFYKLDEENRDSGRRDLLNQALYKLYGTGAQYYLTGPNIDGLTPNLPEEVSAHFMKTKYRTVAVDYIQETVRDGETDLDALRRVVSGLRGPTLIYCRSLARVREAVQALAGMGASDVPTKEVASLSEWAAQNFHPEWFVASALKSGVGTHNSAVPRSLARRIVDLFNAGDLNYLVCTSTLIEGVNTAARNVIIFDDVLDRRPLDHFTYANISGRAGRMFKNFVGTVVSFSEAPVVEETLVDFPVLSQSDRATSATLLQIDPTELNDSARQRLKPIVDQEDISLETLRRNRGLDPELQINVARELRAASSKQHELLNWSGMPTFEQLEYACGLLLALTPSGSRSGTNARSLATRLNRMRVTDSDLPTLIREQLVYAPDPSRATESVLGFMRNWAGHRVPNQLRALEIIVNEVRRDLGLNEVSYATYVARVEALFLPLHFVTLEEYGVPYAASRKLVKLGLRGTTLDELLHSLSRVAGHARLSAVLHPAEIPMVKDAASSLGV